MARFSNRQSIITQICMMLQSLDHDPIDIRAEARKLRVHPEPEVKARYSELRRECIKKGHIHTH